MTKLVHQTPLDILADELAAQKEDELARTIFDSYDAFLWYLDDNESRKRLESLSPEAAVADQVFQQVQALANDFEVGLEKLFFDSDKLRSLTRSYGVF